MTAVNSEVHEPIMVGGRLLVGQRGQRPSHCPAGHAYDQANTYITREGSRQCRACHRERERVRRGARPTLLDRLLSRVQFSDETDCWLWMGHVARTGYASIWVGPDRASGRKVYAHRALYELLVGPIPAGLQLDHLCRTRCCINPDHLEPVTQAENVRRAALVITHCPAGHEYTPENTYICKRGARSCRICARQRWTTWAIRRREAAA